MKRSPELESFRAKLGVLDLKPLRVELEMDGPVMGYDPLHLDGLLAWCVVEAATQGRGLPPSAEPYDLPLPLACLWRDPDSGLPLWASTDFEPVGGARRVVGYWHKRVPRSELVHLPPGRPWNIRPGRGEYRELRIPLPGWLCRRWRADCLGDPLAIASLLRLLPATVGKKRSQGYGSLRSITIHEISQFSLFDEGGEPRRPVPLRALVEVAAGLPVRLEPYGRVGWTPPYWLPVCQEESLLRPPPVPLAHRGVGGSESFDEESGQKSRLAEERQPSGPVV